MKTTQKGFAVPLVLAVIAVLIIGGGAYFYINTKSQNITSSETPEKVVKVGNNKLFDEIVFSRNSPFAVMSETKSASSSHLSGDQLQGIGLLDIRTNYYVTLTDKNGIIGTGQNSDYSPQRSLFSPSGELVVYPVVRRDSDLTSTNENGTWTYYYELYLYDTNKKQSQLLTKEKKDLMLSIPGSTGGFPGTDGSMFGWINNNTIIYTCGDGRSPVTYTVYQGICSVDINTGKVSKVGEQTTLNKITKTPSTLKILPNESNSTEDGSKNRYYNNNGNLKIVMDKTSSTGKLEQKIVVDNGSNGSQKDIIFTGLYDKYSRAPYTNLYWTNDDHIYGRTPGNEIFQIK